MNPYYANILKAISNGDKLTNIHKSASISYSVLKQDYKKAKKEFKLLHSNPIFCICPSSSKELNNAVHSISEMYGIPIAKPYQLQYEDVSHIFYTKKTTLKKQGVKMIPEWAGIVVDFKKDIDFNTRKENARIIQML